MEAVNNAMMHAASFNFPFHFEVSCTNQLSQVCKSINAYVIYLLEPPFKQGSINQ